MELPIDPVIPLLGIHPKNPEKPVQKNLRTSILIAVLFTIAKCRKSLSAHQQISGLKNWYIYTMKYYAAQRKKEVLPFATARMEVESSMLSEISW